MQLRPKLFKRAFRSFDPTTYLASNPDVIANGIDAQKHFLASGWREGRNANSRSKSLIAQVRLGISWSDPKGGEKILEALENNGIGFAEPDEAGEWRMALTTNLLLDGGARRFLLDCIEVMQSTHFDADWVVKQAGRGIDDPLEFFVRHGQARLLDPGSTFSTSLYLRTNPEARISELSALQHYLRFAKTDASSQTLADTSSIRLSAGEIDNPHMHITRQWHYRDINSRLKTSANEIEFAPATLDAPIISLLTPVYNVDLPWLDQMVNSVRHQTSGNWELVLVDDHSTYPGLHERLKFHAESDSRIKLIFRSSNGNISAATNDALRAATGKYVGLLDNDDALTCDAIATMLDAICKYDPDMLFSDEFKIDSGNRPSALFAKPGWSPIMLTNYMYTGHFSVYRRDLIVKLGGFRSAYDMSQDYDLALRASEATSKIVHVEAFLYGWRMIATSGSSGGKPMARLTNVRALQSAADRRGWDGVAVGINTANKIVFDRSSDRPLVSIIVPSDNLKHITDTIMTIVLQTTYPKYEIIIVTRSVIGHGVPTVTGVQIKVVPYDKPFNFSDKCNVGAEAASGDVVLFFNDDVSARGPDWLDGIIDYLQIEGVGAVSPKMLYENGLIQYAGMVTGVRRLIGTAFHALPASTNVHFNMALCARDVSILSGALCAIRKDVFDAVGGFDAVNAPIMHSDVDLSLRIREAGYRLVYTPYVEMTHIGHLSLGSDETHDFAKFKKREKNKADIFHLQRFGSQIASDPYFTKSMRELLYHDSAETFEVFIPERQCAGDRSDVLLVSHDLSGSGAPRILCEIAELLIRSRYNVVVVSPADGVLRSRLQQAGAIVIVDALADQAQDYMVEFAWNFDTVICNTIVPWKLVKRLQGHEHLIWYIHEGDFIDEIARNHQELEELLQSSPRVVTVSHHAGARLVRHGCAYQLLPPGVKPSSLDRPAVSHDRLRFGVFGTYEVRKGQDIAAYAFSVLPAEVAAKVELHTYGRSHDLHFENEIRRIYKDVTNIHFHPALPQADYEAEIADLDVVLVPSRDDTGPLSAIDALANGKPVICSATTGVSQHLVHGESALIAQINTGVEIARLVTEMLDPELRERLGKGALQVYERTFTISAFESRLAEVFGLDILPSDIELQAEVVV